MRIRRRDLCDADASSGQERNRGQGQQRRRRHRQRLGQPQHRHQDPDRGHRTTAVRESGDDLAVGIDDRGRDRGIDHCGQHRRTDQTDRDRDSVPAVAVVLSHPGRFRPLPT